MNTTTHETRPELTDMADIDLIAMALEALRAELAAWESAKAGAIDTTCERIEH